MRWKLTERQIHLFDAAGIAIIIVVVILVTAILVGPRLAEIWQGIVLHIRVFH